MLARLTQSLYVRFAVLAGIAVTLAGAVGVWHQRDTATHQAQLRVWRQAAFMADRLGRDDLARSAIFQPASGTTQALLDDVFDHTVVSPGIVRVTLMRSDGTVTYSSEHDLIGMPTDRPDLLAEALAKGNARATTDGGGRRLLMSYVPVRWVLSTDGGPSGALAVYTDYAPVAAEIRRSVSTGAATLAVALLLLYAALFPILHSVTRKLADRNRQIAEQADEKLGLERRLRQTHRAEAVGRLAAGVAHDFNNLLTGIGSYADLVANDVPSSSPARWHAAEISKATARGAALTRHLLDFERRTPAQPVVVDLNAVLRETLPLLRRLIGENVELDVHSGGEDELRVLTDPAQLEQLFVDLVLNARDALPDGGVVTVTTQAERGAAVLLVRDSGAESESRHGLELASLWELVRGSGGTIELGVEPGAGTTVRVAMPLAKGPLALPPRAPDPPPAVTVEAAPTATVLLVEDEEIVRAVVREVLETAGYTVVAAHNGRLALEVCAERGGGVDLVLSDVVMPEVGGIELAELLRESYPDLSVVLMSGYPERDGDVAGGIRWLQKPFSHSELLHEVAAALAERVLLPA
jgi:two-component system cell cycle sensor histidine kinase/response regulator CckA